MSEQAKPNKQYEPEMGAIWTKKSQKDGSTYLSIQFEEEDSLGEKVITKYLAFANKFKTPENNQPNFRIYKSRDNTEQAKPQTQSKTTTSAPKPKKTVKPEPQPESLPDETGDGNL